MKHKPDCVPFIQPRVGSNGALGGNRWATKASSELNSSLAAYNAFCGNTEKEWHSDNGFPQWLIWYNPNPLFISRITFRGDQGGSTPDRVKEFEIHASNDGNTWRTMYVGENEQNVSPTLISVPIDNSQGYKYWRYYVKSTFSREYAHFRDVKIDAIERISYPIGNLYGKKQSNKEKIEWIPWKQPVLSSDTSSPEMTLSATSVYSGYPMWQAFDNKSSTGWLSADGTKTGSLRVQFNKELKIDYITVKGWANNYGRTQTVTIYKDFNDSQLIGAEHTYTEANQSSTWSFIDNPIITDTLSFYATSNNNSWCCIDNIYINAYEKNKLVAGYNDWTQPQLLQDGIMGGDDYACETNSVEGTCYAYCAFDQNADTWWENHSVMPCWLTFYSPVPLLINSVDITTRGSFYTFGIKIQARNENTDWLDLTQEYAFSTANHTDTIPIRTSTNYQYFRIYCSQGSGDDISLPSVVFKGRQYITEDMLYKTTKSVGMKTDIATTYWKYSGLPWTQESITSNGEIGGDRFAVTSNSANESRFPTYYAYDGTSNEWITQTKNAYTIFYNPVPLNVTALQITNPTYSTTVNYSVKRFQLYGSNDNAEYFFIANIVSSNTSRGAEWFTTIGNSKFYKYHKIVIEETIGDWWGFKEIKISASQQVALPNGTPDDYDYTTEQKQFYTVAR